MSQLSSSHLSKYTASLEAAVEPNTSYPRSLTRWGWTSKACWRCDASNLSSSPCRSPWRLKQMGGAEWHHGCISDVATGVFCKEWPQLDLQHVLILILLFAMNDKPGSWFWRNAGHLWDFAMQFWWASHLMTSVWRHNIEMWLVKKGIPLMGSDHHQYMG